MEMSPSLMIIVGDTLVSDWSRVRIPWVHPSALLKGSIKKQFEIPAEGFQPWFAGPSGRVI